MPCPQHQELLQKQPTHFFHNLLRTSHDIAATVSILHRWAAWVLQQSTEEDKWEVAACLETQALAVHYNEPRIPDEEYDEGSETYEAEYCDYDDPRSSEAERAASAKRRQEKREARAAARQERHVKRSLQQAALKAVWRQIHALALQFFQAEGVEERPELEDFMAHWEALRTKLAASPARKEYRQSWALKRSESSHYLVSMLAELMNKALQLAGASLTDVGVMVLGSLGRNEALPFSDVEFAVVLANLQQEALVWKAVRIFRFFVTLFAETPYSVLPEKHEKSAMFSTEDGGWSFAPNGLHVDTGVTLIVAEVPAIVALQESASVDIVTRTALRQVSYMCGNEGLVQSYQNGLAEFWASHPHLRRTVAQEQLTTATQKFDAKVEHVCHLKPISRVLCLSLEAMAMWHGLSGVGNMALLAALRGRGVLSWDTAEQLAALLEVLMLNRTETQLRAHCQNDELHREEKWSPPQRSFFLLLRCFHEGLVAYSKQLLEVPPLPAEPWRAMQWIKPVVFTLLSPAVLPKPNKSLSQKIKDKVKVVLPKSTPKEKAASAPTNSAAANPSTGGSSQLARLVMVRDMLQPFLSLTSRMSVGATCQSLRLMSPGTVVTVTIHSTADARAFLSDPPTLGSHILQLGGYWKKQAPYSKRHAIPQSSWNAYHAEDKLRRELMDFNATTLDVLMHIRPHHRVVGLTLDKGKRDITAAQFAAFWARIAPNIGSLSINDYGVHPLDEMTDVLAAYPFRGSYLRVSNCGNCWNFLLQVLEDNHELEGLYFSWPNIDGSYYHGPEYNVPSMENFSKCTWGLPYLRWLTIHVSEERKSPSNSTIINSWLLPKASNLRELKGWK